MERAIALEPNYAEAHWQLALVQNFNWLNYNEDQEPNRRNALNSAKRAVELDPNDSSARSVLGDILGYECRWDEALAHYEASLRLNPNDADALAGFADFLVTIGKPKEALDSMFSALRLNPHHPGWYYWVLGTAQIANGQYEDAVVTLRREEIYRAPSRRYLVAALALSGRVQEAKEEARFFLAAYPHWRISTFMETHRNKSQKDDQLWIDAFRLGGLPE